MHPAFQRLFERHVAGSFDRQWQLSDLVGEHDWQLDIDRGWIEFAGLGQWRVQVLGLASARTGTWLWAWAIHAIEVPPGLLKVTEGLRQIGQAKGIPEFTDFELPRGEQTGTRLALTASGLFKADAFYRAPYAGGALYVLLADPAFPRPQVDPAERIPAVLPHVLGRFPEVNHRQVLEGYLAYYGLGGEEDGPDVLIYNGAGAILRAQFDEHNRLAGFAPPM